MPRHATLRARPLRIRHVFPRRMPLLPIGPLVVAALSAQVPDVVGTGFLPGVGRAGLKI